MKDLVARVLEAQSMCSNVQARSLYIPFSVILINDWKIFPGRPEDPEAIELARRLAPRPIRQRRGVSEALEPVFTRAADESAGSGEPEKYYHERGFECQTDYMLVLM